MRVQRATIYILAAMAAGLMTMPAHAVNCDKNPDHPRCDGSGNPPGGGGKGDPTNYSVEFHDLWGGSSGVGILTVHDADRGWADYSARQQADGCQGQPVTWQIAMVREQLATGKDPAHNVLTSDGGETVLDLVNTGVDWQRNYPAPAAGSFNGCFNNGVLRIDFRDTSKKRRAPTEVMFHWEFEVFDDGFNREYLVLSTNWLYPSEFSGGPDIANQHWSPNGSVILSIDGDFDFRRVVKQNGLPVSDDLLGSARLQFWFNTQSTE